MSTLSEYRERLKRQAKRAFETHEITEDNLTAWRIQKRYKDGRGWSSTHEARIAVLGPYLVVVGDIDTVAFAYGSGGPLDVVQWIGLHQSIDYLAQKAAIGTGREVVEVWDYDVATDQVDAWLADCDNEDCDKTPCAECAEAEPGYAHECEECALSRCDSCKRLLESRSEISDEGAHAFYSSLEYEWLECQPGMVTAPRVFYAWAAVARLWQLLKDRD